MLRSGKNFHKSSVSKQEKIRVSKEYSSCNIFKQCQNEMFVGAIKKSQNSGNLRAVDKDSFVGVLDSVEENTCRALLRAGLKKDNILLIEHSVPIGKKHTESGFPTHIGSLDSFADTKDNEIYYRHPDNNWYGYKCIAFLFDTCGQVNTQGPQILATLQAINIVPGCVITATFCRARISKEKHLQHRTEFLQNVMRVLLEKGVIMHRKVSVMKYAGDGQGNRGAPMEFLLITSEK